MERPTGEEIARVEAWQAQLRRDREAENARRKADEQRVRQEASRQAHAAVREKVYGRRIVDVLGEFDHYPWDSADPDSLQWRTIRFVLDDGNEIALEVDRWNDPICIEVEIREASGAARVA